MTIEDVAKGLVDLCRQGKSDQAVETYYHPDIVSVEAQGMPDMPAEIRGIDAVKQKHAWWYDHFEVHSEAYDGPYVNGDRFAVFNTIDTTMKATGRRVKMSEIALYTVQDGKVVHEAFFAKPDDCA